MSSLWFLLGLLWIAAGRLSSDCDPLVPENCLLPYPNDFFTRNDSSTITGIRVHFGPTSLPESNFKKEHLNPDDWNELDGWPVIPAITAYFPDVSLDNAPRHWNIGASVASSSPSMLLNAITGERIPHWLELDNSTDTPLAERALLMWPAYHLNESTPYIVSYHGLKTTDSTAVPPSEAFQALRDGLPSNDPSVENRRELYKEIFSKLDAAGVPQHSVQLAWRFTVGSRKSITERLVHMRDDATTRLPSGGPHYTILQKKTNFSDHIDTIIHGAMQVPLYLTSAFPGAELVLNAEGLPSFQRFVPAEFTVMIPRSLAATGKAGRVLQYGHGLFGHQNEVQSGYLQRMADEYGYVLVAVDWWGLSWDDEPGVVEMMGTNLGRFRIIPDRSAQGILNALMAMKLVTGDFRNDKAMTFQGKSVVDPSKTAYYGNSEGGILGGVYMALSQDVERGVLGVPGGPYGLLLPRSADFSQLFMLLKARYASSLDRIMLLQLMQMQWDRAEPSGYMNAVAREPLPNTPRHTVIIHYGLGDAQVSWLGAHTEGRSIGCKMFNNNVHYKDETLFGFEFVSGPVTNQSMIVGWNFGAPEAPLSNIPPSKKTDAHEKPRRDPRAQEQLHHFFETGEIIDTCKGQGCNPI